MLGRAAPASALVAVLTARSVSPGTAREPEELLDVRLSAFEEAFISGCHDEEAEEEREEERGASKSSSCPAIQACQEPCLAQRRPFDHSL
jgi:hypothetical protein